MMLLTKIIDQLSNVVETSGDLSIEVTGISYDSRQVNLGHIFIAVRGLTTDGHDHIPAALKAGARVIVYDREDVVIPEQVAAIQVDDSRLALPVIASSYFGHPEDVLRLIAITGTNGKTTTNYFLQHLLEQEGFKAGRIGTTGAQMKGVEVDLIHTTPESADLYSILAEFVTHGAKAATLEVSSHALAQHRVDGLRFDAALFTNLTQDHLDYHGSLEDYLAAKQLLFQGLPEGSVAIINVDDPYAERFIQVCKGRVILYGYAEQADYRILDHSINDRGVALQLITPKGQREVQVNTVGRFNYYNFLAAYAAALELAADVDQVELLAQTLPHVPGRLEKLQNAAPFQVFVDYAHTPDAMETVLGTLAEAYPDKQLITVFGCGGDRDRGKRPIMGEIATRLSTKVFITDDNPRTETPMSIIEEIIDGCGERSNYRVIQDRTEAILAALKAAGPGDIVALLGKGHEPYQEIMGVRKPFSDMSIVDQFMEQYGYSA